MKTMHEKAPVEYPMSSESGIGSKYLRTTSETQKTVTTLAVINE